ncbi:MAG TPA: LamG domain-containing protein [Marinobacter sp.]|uniref:LamG-like jellyroll fold domain-containing protein n=1 Tax=marine sediment metagenome TaxID=412755 RepID=A0A0F9PFX2_9ZZZZ|nr:LamG domain-containing protein [Marinobacter sp.]
MSNPAGIPITSGLVLALVPSLRSLLDFSGADRHPTFAGSGLSWIRQNGVYRIRAESTGRLVIPNDATLEAITDFSLFCAGSFSSSGVFARILNKRGVGGTQIDLYMDGGIDVELYDGASTRVAVMGSWDGVNSFTVNVESGVLGTLSANGFYRSDFNAPPTITANSADVTLWNYYSGNAPFTDTVKALLLYNRVLDADEDAQNHAWSESLTSPTIPHDRRFFDLGSLVPHGNAGGEMGSYDFRDVVGRTLPDRSGDGNDGSLEGQATTAITDMGQAGRFTADESRVELASDVVGNAAVSFSALVRANSSGGAGGGRLTDNTKFLVYFRLANRISLSSNGGVTKIESPASSILYGQWHHLVVTRDTAGNGEIFIDGEGVATGATGTPIAAGAVVIGNRAAGNRGWDGEIKNAILHDRVLDAAEVKAAYQPIRRKLLYKLGDLLPTLTDVLPGQVIPGTDYTVRTGTHSVAEAVGRDKAVENVVAGLYTRPQPDAFGTFRFKFNKAAASNLFWGFIASTPAAWNDAAMDGYQLQVNADERVAIRRINSGGATVLFASAVGYVVAGTDYEIAITRTLAGVFKAYILGGAYTAWTLIGTSAPDVTHVTSVYAATEAAVGDLTNMVDMQFHGELAP